MIHLICGAWNRKKLFIPQFHGREHLNVAIWLRNLQKGDRNTKIAFDYGCWGFANKNQYLIDYQAAFDLEFYNDIKSQSKIIYEGLILLKKFMGTRLISLFHQMVPLIIIWKKSQPTVALNIYQLLKFKRTFW